MSLCKNFRRFFFSYASYQWQYIAYSWENLRENFWHGNSFLVLMLWTKSAQSYEKKYFLEGKCWLLRVGMLLITGFVLVYRKSLSTLNQIFHSVSLLCFIVGMYLSYICMREIPSHYIIPLSACIFYPHKKSLNWFHHRNKWM